MAIGILWAALEHPRRRRSQHRNAKRLASPVAPKVQVKADEAKAKSVHQKCRGIWIY